MIHIKVLRDNIAISKLRDAGFSARELKDLSSRDIVHTLRHMGGLVQAN